LKFLARADHNDRMAAFYLGPSIEQNRLPVISHQEITRPVLLRQFPLPDDSPSFQKLRRSPFRAPLIPGNDEERVPAIGRHRLSAGRREWDEVAFHGGSGNRSGTGDRAAGSNAVAIHNETASNQNRHSSRSHGSQDYTYGAGPCEQRPRTGSARGATFLAPSRS